MRRWLPLRDAIDADASCRAIAATMLRVMFAACFFAAFTPPRYAYDATIIAF